LEKGDFANKRGGQSCQKGEQNEGKGIKQKSSRSRGRGGINKDREKQVGSYNTLRGGVKPHKKGDSPLLKEVCPDREKEVNERCGKKEDYAFMKRGRRSTLRKGRVKI